MVSIMDEGKVLANVEADTAWLNMIQAIITRMSNYGFIIKGWGLTVATGLIALTVNDPSNEYFALLSLLPVVVFWVLDAWFLRTENRFRNFYNWARKKSSLEHDFIIDINHSDLQKVDNIILFMFRKTVGIFWITLIIVGCGVWVILND